MTGEMSGNLVGKRYHCETCGTEVICVEKLCGHRQAPARPTHRALRTFLRVTAGEEGPALPCWCRRKILPGS